MKDAGQTGFVHVRRELTPHFLATAAMTVFRHIVFPKAAVQTGQPHQISNLRFRET